MDKKLEAKPRSKRQGPAKPQRPAPVPYRKGVQEVAKAARARVDQHKI
jgi:hypothetical protein